MRYSRFSDPQLRYIKDRWQMSDEAMPVDLVVELDKRGIT